METPVEISEMIAIGSVMTVIYAMKFIKRFEMGISI